MSYLGGLMPGLTVHSIPSGTTVLDWIVPDEWTLRGAYIEDESGQRIIDLANSNLHVVGYSEPVDAWFSLEDLQPHLHSLPEQPDAIPYITSYYQRRWGFCLTHNQRMTSASRTLSRGHRQHACAGRSQLGRADIARADEQREVLLSTYICHPSMANNELSGPVVVTALARWLAAMPRAGSPIGSCSCPRRSARSFSSASISMSCASRTIAGFVATCCGDDAPFTFMPSRLGGTLADRVVTHVLGHHAPGALAGVLPRQQAIEKIKESIQKTYGKRGESVLQSNWAAVDGALASLQQVQVPASATSTTYQLSPLAINANNSTDFVARVTSMLTSGKGDLIPVSALPVDGTFPTNTARFEKRSIAQEIPIWDIRNLSRNDEPSPWCVPTYGYPL